MLYASGGLESVVERFAVLYHAYIIYLGCRKRQKKGVPFPVPRFFMRAFFLVVSVLVGLSFFPLR